MRQHFLWLCVGASLLVGCNKPPVVFPCPPPPVVTQPSLRTASLDPQSSPDQVTEAYVLDLADWVGYATQLQVALDAYRPAPSFPPK